MFNGKYKVNRLFVEGKHNGYLRLSDFNIKDIERKLNTVHLNNCMDIICEQNQIDRSELYLTINSDSQFNSLIEKDD